MMKFAKFNFIILTLLFSQLSWAQEKADVGGETMKDVYTVGGIGAGGAILGLSTLSFAEEPKEELRNILIGAAIGVIIGVGVVAYQHATKSRELYEESAFMEYIREERRAENKQNTNQLEIPYLSYSFVF